MKRRTWGSALAALLVTAWAATARAETIKIEISISLSHPPTALRRAF